MIKFFIKLKSHQNYKFGAIKIAHKIVLNFDLFCAIEIAHLYKIIKALSFYIFYF